MLPTDALQFAKGVTNTSGIQTVAGLLSRFTIQVTLSPQDFEEDD